MTRAGPIALLLLTGMGGVACGAQRDSSRGPDGGAGRVSAGGAAGVGGAGNEAGPGDAAAEADASDAAASAGGAGVVDTTGPIVGTPLATFDTTLDGFILNTTNSGVIVGNSGVQLNLGGFTTGLPRAELAHDAAAGSPTPGCLELSVPFTGGCCEFAEVLAATAGVQDWSGRVLHARVRVASGTFDGVAQLLATSSTVTSAWSTAELRTDGSWQELTLDLRNPPRPSLGFDPTQTIELGLQFHAGPNFSQLTRGLVVFQVDSFSLEQPNPPADAAADP
jgi:hypothetical protein